MVMRCTFRLLAQSGYQKKTSLIQVFNATGGLVAISNFRPAKLLQTFTTLG